MGATEKAGDRKSGRDRIREHYERDREERRAGSFAFFAVI